MPVHTQQTHTTRVYHDAFEISATHLTVDGLDWPWDVYKAEVLRTTDAYIAVAPYAQAAINSHQQPKQFKQ